MKRWIGLCVVLVMLLSPLGCSTNAPADSSSDDVATPTSVSTTTVTTTVPTTTKTAAKKTTRPTTKKPTTVKKTTAAPTTTTTMTPEQGYALVRDAIAEVTESFKGNPKPIVRAFFIKSHMDILDGKVREDTGDTEAYTTFAPLPALTAPYFSYHSDFLGCPTLQYSQGPYNNMCYGQYLAEPNPIQFKFWNSGGGFVENANVLMEAAMEMFKLPSDSSAQDVQLRESKPEFSEKKCKSIKLSIPQEEFELQYRNIIRYGFLMLPKVAITAEYTVLENSAEFFVDSDGKYLGMTLQYTIDLGATEQHDVTVSVWGGQEEVMTSEKYDFNMLDKTKFTQIPYPKWIVYDKNDTP